MTANHYFAEQPKSEAKFGLIKTTLRGKQFEFLTATGVFSTRCIDTGTRLLIESMTLPEEGCVLDLGCGYGAVGIAAAKFNPNLQVIMTDVNRRAINLAKHNIQKNRAYNAEVRHGQLYEPVENLRFNCVLSNPPVSAGMSTIQGIIHGAPKVMAQKATFQMVIQSKIGRKTLPQLLTETFGNFTIAARESGYRVLAAQKG